MTLGSSKLSLCFVYWVYKHPNMWLTRQSTCDTGEMYIYIFFKDSISCSSGWSCCCHTHKHDSHTGPRWEDYMCASSYLVMWCWGWNPVCAWEDSSLPTELNPQPTTTFGICKLNILIMFYKVKTYCVQCPKEHVIPTNYFWNVTR